MRYPATEFAKIEDRYSRIHEWDFTAEWEDEALNVQSILQDEGIQGNIDMVTDAHAKGFDIVFITSRGGGEKTIERSIEVALSERLGFPVTGFALGDYETYGKDKLPVKKQRILQQLVQEYDEVMFMDDEDKNLELAKEVAGVIVMKALGY
jgi:hypothetical protein